MYFLFVFTIVISEIEPNMVSLTSWADKITEFSDESPVEKKRLLVDQLSTQVEELFPDSLNEPRNICNVDQTKKKCLTYVIPRINRRKKLEGEASDDAVQKVPKLTSESSLVKPQLDDIVVAVARQMRLVVDLNKQSFG